MFFSPLAYSQIPFSPSVNNSFISTSSVSGSNSQNQKCDCVTKDDLTNFSNFFLFVFVMVLIAFAFKIGAT
jgi:hypothetical protein